MKLTYAVLLILCLGGCAANTDTGMNGSSARERDVNGNTAATADIARPALFDKPLPWPVSSGSVVKQFGDQINPVLGTVTHNPGIDISVPVGSPVMSVAPGKVSLIESIPGYGNIVILEHDNAVFSVYAHLSEISLTKGDAVAAQQVIAMSGESIDGPGLHFELWHQRQKQNPLLLLEQR
ncbi:MAG: M23 family metallopeptidase [Bacteroidia bacterium]|nr:M23 family metallopeptidase [Bacteroidia bacterium]